MNASTRPRECRRCNAARTPNMPGLHGDRPTATRKRAILVVVFSLAALARPAVAPDQELVLVRLRYKVDHNSRPNDWNAKGFGKVLNNVSEALTQATSVKTARDPSVFGVGDPDIFSYPFLFMVGHYGPILNEAEAENLREHLTKGGFLLATSCCGNGSFTRNFEREMRRLFPENELKPLPPEHPVFRTFYTIEEATRLVGANETNARKERPLLRGIDVDGRTVVILSPVALTCGWTRRATCTATCKRYATEDAFKIGVNVIIYAMTH
ncbi:MAG: DUF4159 domain-containing protein [Phycisphaerales bacterium]|nr:MAG: DUF4159 domain-containing protein [Phycisphaerales bacterium]